MQEINFTTITILCHVAVYAPNNIPDGTGTAYDIANNILALPPNWVPQQQNSPC